MLDGMAADSGTGYARRWSTRTYGATIRGAAAGLLAALMVPAVSAAEPAGPPAPTPRHEAAVRRVVTPGARAAAEAAWPWYAVGWAVDAGSTVLALQRPDVQESNPIFGDRPAVVLAVKAGVAVGLWRLGVAHPKRAALLKWMFLAGSLAAGVWNVSVAF